MSVNVYLTAAEKGKAFGFAIRGNLGAIVWLVMSFQESYIVVKTRKNEWTFQWRN